MTRVSAIAARPVAPVLVGLVLLDLVLTVAAGFFPALWFRVFHGAPYIDPQGLLRRCIAGNWLAFLVLQALALRRWRREPWWLVLLRGWLPARGRADGCELSVVL